MTSKPLISKIAGSNLALMCLLLVAVLAALLGGGCLPGCTLFSNDAPLGRIMAACHRLPERFSGCWADLNSVGYRELAAVPSISYGLEWLLRPLWFSRLYAPLALLLLGLSAWYCLRQFGLGQPACVLGGLAAALNSGFFSASCWGVAGHAITVGMSFLAVAALTSRASGQSWVRAALGGLALGMAVTEGADIGAIFSVFVAGFVVWHAWQAEGPRAKNLGLGVLRVALAAVCAVALATEVLHELLVTDVEGIAEGTERNNQTKEGHWNWVTQWSLPKAEALGLVVPGLFGYKVDSTDGAAYWGATGRDAAWERYLAGKREGPPPSGFIRFVGGGNYVGVPIALLAVWTAAQCFRRKNSVFAPSERRLLWFWLGSAVVSLLLAFGRYAPFYRWVYWVPHFSDIRNPVKFIHMFSFSLVILFAYGVDSLWRMRMRPAGLPVSTRWAGLRSWWKSATGLEKRWPQGCLVVLALSLAAWWVYANARCDTTTHRLRLGATLFSWATYFDNTEPALEQYLHSVEFDPGNTQGTAQSIASFSIRQVFWFVLFFTLVSGLMVLVLSGAFAGKRAVWGAICLGVMVVIDLGRADRPWVRVWDYAQKYATNPIVERLSQKSYEHRVADMPREFLEPEFQGAFGKKDPTAKTDYLLYQVYSREWAQHLFCYYNVQSLDLVQLPRKPKDLKAFEEALTPHSQTNLAEVAALLPRRWQLTNTRYVLGSRHFLYYFDHDLDPVRQRLRIVQPFKLNAKPGVLKSPGLVTTADVTAEPTPDGPFALFEFTGALPRARLYNHWQVTTNDQEALHQIVSASFDPEQSVVVGENLPLADPPAGASPDPGKVEFVSYAPKHIVLEAQATGPSVLMLADRFDPEWNVRVDGQPARLFRCNYIMRGVYLAAGPHRVEFRFQPPTQTLYVSLAALSVGLLLLGFVGVSGFRQWANLASVGTGPRAQAPRKPGNRKNGRGGGPANGARESAVTRQANGGRPAGRS